MVKKKGEKKPPLPIVKWYGEERFALGRFRKTKTAASEVAKSYRDDGYKARVFDSRDGYGIYVRKRGQMRRLLERDRKRKK